MTLSMKLQKSLVFRRAVTSLRLKAAAKPVRKAEQTLFKVHTDYFINSFVRAFFNLPI